MYNCEKARLSFQPSTDPVAPDINQDELVIAIYSDKPGLAVACKHPDTGAPMVHELQLPTSIKGDTGPQGVQGIQGLKGDQGIKGEKGDVGPKGDTGASGPQGLKGDTGATGPKGDKGVQGDKGLTGDKGATGATGATGAQGPQGVQGAQGIQGVKGDTGLQGPAGGPLTDALNMMQEYQYSWTNSLAKVSALGTVDPAQNSSGAPCVKVSGYRVKEDQYDPTPTVPTTSAARANFASGFQKLIKSRIMFRVRPGHAGRVRVGLSDAQYGSGSDFYGPHAYFSGGQLKLAVARIDGQSEISVSPQAAFTVQDVNYILEITVSGTTGTMKLYAQSAPGTILRQGTFTTMGSYGNSTYAPKMDSYDQGADAYLLFADLTSSTV